MSEKGFGEQLFDKLAQRGLSKSKVYKVLALQRLCDEVRKLGDEGKLREGVLLEISKIATPARQKMLADLAADQGLTVDQVKLFSKLIRAAEKAPPETANDQWDAVLDLKEEITAAGMTDALAARLKQLAGGVRVAAEPAVEAADPELLQSLGRPVAVECVPGRGLDVGTTNIVYAGRTLEGAAHFALQRNAFLDIRNDDFTKRMLIKLGIDHVTHENRMYVIGDPAFELANIFEKETRRPMKDGLISPQEPEALHMVDMVIRQVLGPPQAEGETVYYSVPADPIDADRNVIYHRGALESILRRQGYTPRPMIEGHSVVLAELGAEDYTGIGISCGGGMFNVCVAYKSVPALTFSTSRGGDWVDINVGKALGMPASQATALKEGGVDLAHPRNRQEEAICIYYRDLIHYTLTTIKRQMESAREMPTLSKPVELVCAGGTALIKGFIHVFEEEYRKISFPLEVSRIRLAADPLRVVASGCLAGALEESAARAPGAKPESLPTFSTAKVSAEAVTLVEKLPERQPYQGPDRRSREVEVTVLPSVGKLPPKAAGPAAPEAEARVVEAPKVAAPRKGGAAGPAETVLPGIKTLPPAGRPKAAGPREEVVSLPSARPAPPPRPAGPKEEIVSLPEAAPAKEGTGGPEETVLPPLTKLPPSSAAPAGPAEETLPPVASPPVSPRAPSVYEEEILPPIKITKLPKVPPPPPKPAEPKAEAPAAAEEPEVAVDETPAPVEAGESGIAEPPAPPAEEEPPPLPEEETAPAEEPPKTPAPKGAGGSPSVPPPKKPGKAEPPDLSLPLIT